PHYTGLVPSQPIPLDATAGTALDLLRYARMRFAFALNRTPVAAWLRVAKLPASEQEMAEVSVTAVPFGGENHRGVADMIAADAGGLEGRRPRAISFAGKRQPPAQQRRSCEDEQTDFAGGEPCATSCDLARGGRR